MGEGVALLHPLFDAGGELIDYHVLDVNPAFERITGIEEGRALMALGSALFPDQVSLILDQYRMMLKQQQSVRFEASFAGGQKRLGISAFPMGGSRFAAVFEDLTERKRLEQQLVQAQKMEAVGQLAGGVAHDFNNLLTTILGYSEVVAERFPAGDQGREDLEQVHKAGQAAAALTRQLLAFSRRQILKPVTFDLNARLADTHALVRRLVGEHIEVAFSPSGGSLHVTLDPGQVEQIVLNLAANARDAMPDGGRLTIRTSDMTIADDVRPNGVAITPGRYAVLGVSDTGTGMSADVQARLFEPFFTTKEIGKGTGLGLSTVYGIVKQSGGYITVDSKPGRGSTFHLYFPAAAGCGESADGDRPAPRPYRRSARVLVVEDNEPLRHLAVKTLTRYGYQVLAAEDAAEALSMLETVPRIDLLLTDLGLPGLDGTQLAETVLRQHPAVRVLYMTGHAGDADTRRRLIDDVPLLQKPFTLSALVEHVQEALVR
jgi:signal transduction histidine kinase